MPSVLSWTEPRPAGLFGSRQNRTYITLGTSLIAVGLIIISLVVRTLSFGVVGGVLLSALVALMQQEKEDRLAQPHQVEINEDGIIIDGTLYAYDQFAGFSVRTVTAEHSELLLIQKAHSTPISLHAALSAPTIEQVLEPNVPLLESTPRGRLDPFLDHIRL